MEYRPIEAGRPHGIPILWNPGPMESRPYRTPPPPAPSAPQRGGTTERRAGRAEGWLSSCPLQAEAAGLVTRCGCHALSLSPPSRCHPLSRGATAPQPAARHLPPPPPHCGEMVQPGGRAGALSALWRLRTGRAPGEPRDTPGKVRDAPGQPRDASGQPRDASGQHRDTSGELRDTPGESQDTPGYNGKVRDAPGYTGRDPAYTRIHRERSGMHRDSSGRTPGYTGIHRESPEMHRESSGRAPECTGRSPGCTGKGPGCTWRAPGWTGRAPG